MRARGVVVLCLMVAEAAASPAAEKLFEDGRAALAAGKLDDACDAFRRSAELEPRVGTLLNLGDCEEKRGHVATAWGAFRDAGALAARTNDPRTAEAERRASALASRLAYVTIHVAAVDGVSVTRDGVPVAAAEWEHELPIDPGKHAFAASAPGRQAWDSSVDVAEGEKRRIEIPELVAATEEHGGRRTNDLERNVMHERHFLRPEPSLLSHRIGIGLLAGVDTDKDFVYGGRIVGKLAPAGPGVIRGVAQLLYASGNIDAYTPWSLYSPSIAAEYLIDISEQLAVAGGPAFGMDFYSQMFEADSTQKWFALRASPTIHLGAFDLGLHLQLVFASKTVGMAELGLDYLVW